MSVKRKMCLCAIVGLVLALSGRTEATEVQNKMSNLAKSIADTLKQEDASECGIGEITGPPSPPSASGPGFQTLLAAALQKQNVSINAKAAITIQGDYGPLEEENKKEELILQITLTIRKKGKKINELTEKLNHKANDDIVKLLGMNVDLSDKTKANPDQRNEEMKKQIENPPLHLADTKIKTKQDSVFAVEVFVRRQGEKDFKVVVPEKNKDGNAVVDLKRGDVYKLRLHNTYKIESAVSVTIDGVDAFAFFEPQDKKPAYFLVAPTSHRDVEGWSRGTASLNEFLVGSFSESAAAKTIKSSSKVGTITVCFHPCWTGNTPPEGWEGARNLDPNATGLGKEIKRESKVVPKTIGPLVTAVTIRYNK